MRIDGVAPSIFAQTLGSERGSVDRSPKIVFWSDISLQDAFINPIGPFFKRLFPLGHRNYLSFNVRGLKRRNLGLWGFLAFTLYTDSTVYGQ
jgi:hypothetical protein